MKRRSGSGQNMSGGGGVGSTGKGEHDYAGHNSANDWNTPAARGAAMRGPGPVPGAGEVTAGGPGVAASRKASNMAGVASPAASGGTPKGMRTQYEGE